MFLFELLGREDHPVYQALQVSNTQRQYHFLLSVIDAAKAINRVFLSASFLKALNFHAISCLHGSAGHYRPCEVKVGKHKPVSFYMVDVQMEDFINYVNSIWSQTDPFVLAAFVLWRLNFIHPFVNGNGRTARAACYFVLCSKLGGALPGTTMLPELLKRERRHYVVALRLADRSFRRGNLDLTVLVNLIRSLTQEQIESATQPQP
jgi:Fic family protein